MASNAAPASALAGRPSRDARPLREDADRRAPRPGAPARSAAPPDRPRRASRRRPPDPRASQPTTGQPSISSLAMKWIDRPVWRPIAQPTIGRVQVRGVVGDHDERRRCAERAPALRRRPPPEQPAVSHAGHTAPGKSEPGAHRPRRLQRQVRDDRVDAARPRRAHRCRAPARRAPCAAGPPRARCPRRRAPRSRCR